MSTELTPFFGESRASGDTVHVMMIGLGPEVITTGAGDVRRRHQSYAEQAGQLTMIVSSFGRRLDAQRLSPELFVIPTNSRNRLGFLYDAYRAGVGVCQRGGVDLIVTQDPFSTGLVGYLLKRRFGVPLVISNHSQFLDNSFWIAERPLVYRGFNALAHWLIHRADGLRVVNPAERDKYLRAGVPADRVSMLPTPVPLDRFLEPVDSAAVASLKRELRIDGPMLLWVGNPAQPVKDLDTLFTAFALLRRDVPAAVLVLAGDFSATPRYRERAEAADVASSVRLVGLVPHDRLPVFYQAADLYLHSSRYEGLAKVMVEAAASGTPIVSTAVPGIEAVLEENVSGLLAPIGDAAAIASRAAELLADPERRAEMGRQARRLARERFSRERQIAGVVSLWRRVAGAA